MNEQLSKLKDLLNEASKILITSHVGPDGDSISSSLLLYKTLSHNYPDKKISLTMEEDAPSLSFAEGYDAIKFQPLAQSIDEFKPDLLILLDANTLSRASRDPETAAQSLKDSGTKYAIIDHHEPAGKDESDVYINQGSPAVAQDVYEICFEQLKLKRPEGYAPVALLGIYSDTGGFTYQNERHQKTLEIVSRLIDDGANVETIKNKFEQYNTDQLATLAHLFSNLAEYGGFTYSFIKDEYTDAWTAAGKDFQDLKDGCEVFVNHYSRNIDGRYKGFCVYPDLRAPEKTYGVSFRAVADSEDVSRIAAALGGGGHKPAAGAKIKCQSVDEALGQVKAAINSLK